PIEAPAADTQMSTGTDDIQAGNHLAPDNVSSRTRAGKARQSNTAAPLRLPEEFVIVPRDVGKATEKMRTFVAKIVINDETDDYVSIQYYNTYDKTRRMQNRVYVPVWWVKADSTTTRPVKGKQKVTDPHKWEEYWGTQEEVQQVYSTVEPYIEMFPKAEIVARGFCLNKDGTVPRSVLRYLS
ncbi:MAG: hypothetical protein EBU88_19365, partial [Acidobacteria bacterium]|nr:hypothetical protein [Acidobacteriota bacterium]